MKLGPQYYANIEKKYLDIFKGTGISQMTEQSQAPKTMFFIDTESKIQGLCLGKQAASVTGTDRSVFLGVAHILAGLDREQDAEAIGLIRAISPTVRQFLDDEGTAREYARCVGKQALLVFADLTKDLT
jgi:hypothetical protein